MKFVRLNQGSREWKQWRSHGVGGSDLVGILGLTPPWDSIPTRAQVLAEKVVYVERETTFAMRRGNRLEPIARAAYQRARNCLADPVCVEHDDYPWARVSLDGLCRMCEHRWILELKAPGYEQHDYTLAGLVPDYYLPQCQWQLFCSGLTRLDYASFNDGQRFAVRDQLAIAPPMKPDRDMQEWILEECGKFWLEVEEARAEKRAKLDKITAEFA